MFDAEAIRVAVLSISKCGSLTQAMLVTAWKSAQRSCRDGVLPIGLRRRTGGLSLGSRRAERIVFGLWAYTTESTHRSAMVILNRPHREFNG